MPVVNLPDGTKINFPEGTPEAEMDAVIRSAIGGEDLPARAAQMTPQEREIARTKNDEMGNYLRLKADQPVAGETKEQAFSRKYGGLRQPEEIGLREGATRGYVQGATFGAGDELVAAGATALNTAAFKDPDQPMGEVYDAYLARERGKLRQFGEESPVVAIGSEIAGAIPTGVLTAPSSVPATTAGRVGLGAATGTAQGGVYGYLSGEGEGRAESAGQGAAIGGSIGAAAPLLASGVEYATRYIREGRNAAELGVPRAAANVLRRAAAADETLTGQGADNIQRAGGGAMLADAGENMRSILDTAIQKSGPAGVQARRAINERANQAGRDLTQVLDDVLGAPRGIKATETALRRGTAAARGDAYDDAYRAAINYADDLGRRIENIVRTRVPMSAIRKANALMRVEGAQSRQIMATVAPDGTVSYRRLPDVRQLDYITRALQDVADAADSKGKLGGTTDVGRAYASLRRELRGLVRESVPEYGNALDTAADPISKRSALRIGSRALSASVARDELAEQIAGMSVAERAYVAQGIRSQIDDAMANVKRALTDSNMDAREAVKAIKMLTTRSSRDKMAMLLGQNEADYLFDAIDQSLTAFELKASVAANSKTFARTALDSEVKAQTEEGVLNAIRGGEPVNAAKRATQIVAGRTEPAKQALADETYSALTRLLTGPRGNDAADIVNRMAAAQSSIDPAAERANALMQHLVRSNVAVSGPARNR